MSRKSDRSQTERAATALALGAERVRAGLAAALAPLGLTTQQYRVLAILQEAQPTPLPTLEIGARMLERNPGVTRLLDRLEAKGWVARERGEDRRLVRRSITAAGLALLARCEAPVRAATDAPFASLDRSEVKKLRRLLEAVAADDSND